MPHVQGVEIALESGGLLALGALIGDEVGDIELIRRQQAPRTLVDAQIGPHAADGVLRHAVGDMAARPGRQALHHLGKAFELHHRLIGLGELSGTNITAHGTLGPVGLDYTG